jgi:predicted ester cyclase
MTKEHRALAEKVYDIFNRGATDELDGMFAGDFVEHQELPGQDGTGIAVVKAWMTMWRAAFPDARFEILDTVSEGSTLCVRFRATGTHRGDFMGMAPTGRRFEVEGYDWVRMTPDGKVAEHWGTAEDMKMMTQLGAIPEQAGPIDVTERQHSHN